MNKFFALVAGVAVLFSMSACSDDEKTSGGSTSPGGEEAIAAVNPERVFTTGLPASVNGQTVRTDGSGRVISIGSTTYSYFTSSGRSDSSAGEFDGVIKINDNYKNGNVYFCLNSNGYIKYAKGKISDNRADELYDFEYWFNYNSNGTISYCKWINHVDHFSLEGKYSYNGLNVVKMSCSAKFGGKSDTEHISLIYTDSDHPAGIQNKGFYWFDENLVLNPEFSSYFYYAGMFGMGLENLPLEIRSNKSYYIKCNWTINSIGYPSSVKITETEVVDGEDHSHSYTEYYNWN